MGEVDLPKTKIEDYLDAALAEWAPPEGEESHGLMCTCCSQVIPLVELLKKSMKRIEGLLGESDIDNGYCMECHANLVEGDSHLEDCERGMSRAFLVGDPEAA